MAFTSIWSMLAEVGGFWKSKAYGWWTKKQPKKALLDALAEAKSYEEWEEAAFQLDELLHTDLWRQNASSKYYDYRLMNERRRAIISAREEEDILGLVNLLRSGLVRNLGNITTPRLFNRAYAGTKLLIEEYITQVALAIEYVTALPTTQSDESGWTSQAKLDLLHDTRQAFGRSTLVLQGGAMFGLCHLGVVKALHLRGLLPRIITGTATGALIAALVAIHTEDELLDFLNGDGIDLTAYPRLSEEEEAKSNTNEQAWVLTSRNRILETFLRHIRRFVHNGRFLDVNVLEECVRANVGDLTFEEAYARTRRVLNITVATSGRGGVPNLLNYLTAPNVLISSAALASSASSTSTGIYTPILLHCKDETGAIVPWASTHEMPFQSSFHPCSRSRHLQTSYTNERDSPLSRIAELFNVNHFIVSQTRPYMAPFLLHTHIADTADLLQRPAHLPFLPFPLLLRLLTLEASHRLRQLDAIGLLPPSFRRLLLLNEPMPGASLTLVPALHPGDIFNSILHSFLLRLLHLPLPLLPSLPPPGPATAGSEAESEATPAPAQPQPHPQIAHWVLHGERTVWPAVGALKVRCAIEVELDKCYQVVRRRKPLDAAAMAFTSASVSASASASGPASTPGIARKRRRAASVGVGI